MFETTRGYGYIEFTRWIKRSVNYRCSICLWRAKGHELKLDIVLHHKDSNPYNNKATNLIVVCCDCHDELHGREISRRRRAVVVKRRRTQRHDKQGWPLVDSYLHNTAIRYRLKEARKCE